MNRMELLDKVYTEVSEQTKRGDLKKVMIERAYASIVKNIEKAVSEGESVELSGFGTFKAVDRAEKVGINPITKEKITVPAKKAVKFKPAAAFKEMVNK